VLIDDEEVNQTPEMVRNFDGRRCVEDEQGAISLLPARLLDQ